MKGFILAVFLALNTVVLAQAPKVEPKDGPVAKMIGPSAAKVGQQLKYTTEGSVGKDIQFSISPPTTGFEPVKLLDGKDTPGIIFTPSKAGTYYIAVMLNENNKTGHTILVLSVTGNSPAGVESFPMKDALMYDKANDKEFDEYVQKMEDFFGRMEKIAEASSNWEQFNKSLVEASAAALDTHMSASRKAIKGHLTERFAKVTNPIDKALIRQVQNEIVSTIRAAR